jgi:hypothetical protein
LDELTCLEAAVAGAFNSAEVRLQRHVPAADLVGVASTVLNVSRMIALRCALDMPWVA